MKDSFTKNTEQTPLIRRMFPPVQIAVQKITNLALTPTLGRIVRATFGEGFCGAGATCGDGFDLAVWRSVWSCSAIFKWVVSAHFPGLCPEVGAEA